MAKVFLDTNYLIDAIHRKPERPILASLKNHTIYASPLSFHIYCYIFKIKITDENVIIQRKKIIIVDLSEDLLDKSLNGPTNDLEDNIQLHSSAEADCDYFLTNDRNLMKLTYFGKTRIAEKLD